MRAIVLFTISFTKGPLTLDKGVSKGPGKGVLGDCIGFRI